MVRCDGGSAITTALNWPLFSNLGDRSQLDDHDDDIN